MLRFQVLGPLKVTRESDGQLDLGGPKQRTVLALLIASIGREVSSDAMADALYEGDPPPVVRRRLQTYISLLRRELGNSIRTGDDGWVLEYDAAAVDAIRFEDLVLAGRSLLPGDPTVASMRLRDALGLWRGPAYGELAADVAALRIEANRLEELRLGALETRIEADLRRGESDSLLPELYSILAAHPFRERLRSFLILALYRSGRQTDALSAYQHARRIMAEELGLEPSPELKRLEQGILEQDPALLSQNPLSALVPLEAGYTTGRNPYKGLRPFTEVDADDFFGRDDLVRRLLERLNRRGVAGRLVVVAGPSGSGKSSVIRAGLIPAVQGGEASLAFSHVVVVYPGSDPFPGWPKPLHRSWQNRPEILRSTSGATLTLS